VNIAKSEEENVRYEGNNIISEREEVANFI
jgi:hypothetical protein